MVQDGRVLKCAYKPCQNDSRGQSRYCSDSCRAKASHDRRYKPVKVVQTWTGPVCWCGKPAKFGTAEYPKCGNHDQVRRTEKERWRRLLKDLRGLGLERAREVVRLAVADQAVGELIGERGFELLTPILKPA